jgi:ribosomal protein S18 acetylase RimI-like enzyme
MRVTPYDVEELSQILAVSFPETGWGSPLELREQMLAPGKYYYFAQVSSRTIGHIGVVVGGREVYIRGVGILPEWRRNGYGRQMLAETLRLQIASGAAKFELDVATENESALNIYTSCGFRQSNVYDYYVVF